eukprot:357862-Chlamydomonas_euryale.AAC.9
MRRLMGLHTSHEQCTLPVSPPHPAACLPTRCVKGLASLARRLEADHGGRSTMHPRRDLFWAVTDDAKSVFALLELEPTEEEIMLHHE